MNVQGREQETKLRMMHARSLQRPSVEELIRKNEVWCSSVI